MISFVCLVLSASIRSIITCCYCFFINTCTARFRLVFFFIVDYSSSDWGENIICSARRRQSRKMVEN